MKKTIYESPICEVEQMETECELLQGSGYGAAGEPGGVLDVLDPLNF